MPKKGVRSPNHKKETLNKKETLKRSASQQEARRYRNFPKHSIESTLVLPQKIQDERGGRPMKRLLLAEALGISPSSTNFRDLLSSSFKYGFTEGNEKSDEISLTADGSSATQKADTSKRLRALRVAAIRPAVYEKFFRDYANKRVPSTDMLPKILRSDYGVPSDLTAECAKVLFANGRHVELIRDIGGSPHVLFEAELSGLAVIDAAAVDEVEALAAEAPIETESRAGSPPSTEGSAAAGSHAPKPIFVGHGKNKAPLQHLQMLLTAFQIPHKVVVDEANLGPANSAKG